MERESTGTKYMAANYEGSQSSPRAVEMRNNKKKKKKKKGEGTCIMKNTIFTFHQIL
jgi:hypothetical protein